MGMRFTTLKGITFWTVQGRKLCPMKIDTCAKFGLEDLEDSSFMLVIDRINVRP